MLFRSPITDKGKASFKGRMSLFRSRLTGEYKTLRIDQEPIDSEWVDQMVDVFENGELLVEYSMQEVRNWADSYQ